MRIDQRQKITLPAASAKIAHRIAALTADDIHEIALAFEQALNLGARFARLMLRGDDDA